MTIASCSLYGLQFGRGADAQAVANGQVLQVTPDDLMGKLLESVQVDPHYLYEFVPGNQVCGDQMQVDSELVEVEPEDLPISNSWGVPKSSALNGLAPPERFEALAWHPIWDPSFNENAEKKLLV